MMKEWHKVVSKRIKSLEGGVIMILEYILNDLAMTLSPFERQQGVTEEERAEMERVASAVVLLRERHAALSEKLSIFIPE
jgi:hypothetical protein